MNRVQFQKVLQQGISRKSDGDKSDAGLPTPTTDDNRSAHAHSSYPLCVQNILF